ncbi:hypothetical protein, partial [Bilophila wadsworthia]|uniref:hypothetical protein n=1 Tax=Bilophila wadsworthia TaxID=35833 RepID=UPI0026752C77
HSWNLWFFSDGCISTFMWGSSLRLPEPPPWQLSSSAYVPILVLGVNGSSPGVSPDVMSPAERQDGITRHSRIKR